jgi:hypothetical protein
MQHPGNIHSSQDKEPTESAVAIIYSYLHIHCGMQGLKMCTSTTDAAAAADVRVAVVQAMTGMLQAMHSHKLLWPQERDREAVILWDRTFAVAHEVSPDLTPERVLGLDRVT